MNAINKHMRQVEEGMTLLDQGEVETLINLLKIVRRKGGVVYTFGNGGSAATASHFANDSLKMGRVKAICLNDSYPVVSAYGNDEGWEKMYMHPLIRLFNADRDVAFGISCSGNSANVIKALEWALGSGGVAVGLTGSDDYSRINKLELLALVHARVPDIRVQEDLHSIVCHAVMRALQEIE